MHISKKQSSGASDKIVRQKRYQRKGPAYRSYICGSFSLIDYQRYLFCIITCGRIFVFRKKENIETIPVIMTL